MVCAEWKTMKLKDQFTLVEEVIAREIGAYLELDGGGVEVVDIVDGKKIIIIYEGACRSCPSSVGATLTSMQNILRDQIDPELELVPDFS